MLDAEQATQTEADAIALSEVTAGYDKTPARSDKLPAEVVAEPLVEVTAPDLAAELRDLKARVTASQGEADSVRRLHGEIGNINRTLLKLQTPAPAPDEGDAALDAIGEGYPELAALVTAAKNSRLAQLSQAPEDDGTRKAARQAERRSEREEDAMELLSEEHPDYMTVRETPEYKAWLRGKSAEFQTRFASTWNPAIVSRGLDEFKDSLKKREVKQTRLAGAITPQGVSQKVGQHTLSDEEAQWVGYNKGRNRLQMNR